jgi:hypothetical protein
MRTREDITKNIKENLLAGDSTIYFEHGYTYPKIGNRAVIGITPKQVIFKAGTRSFSKLNRTELVKIEQEIINYYNFVKATV